MGVGLDALPTELVEAILDQLGLSDIKALRLVNRSWRTRGLNFHHFFACLKHRTTDLSEDSLRRLGDLAAHPTLGKAVSTVTILAAVPDVEAVERIVRAVEQETPRSTISGEDLAGFRWNLEWLKAQEAAQLSEEANHAALESLTSAFRSFGQLDQIKLDAGLLYGPNQLVAIKWPKWHPIWERASRVHHLALSAIAQSGIRLGMLDLYRQARHCYILSASLTSQVEDLKHRDLSLARAGIRSLALGISTYVMADREITEAARTRTEANVASFLYEVCGSRTGLLGHGPDLPQATSEVNFPGIARLLQSLPDLHALDLHLYWTLRDSTMVYSQILTNVAQDAHLTQLEVCSLSGFPATEEALVRFIKNHAGIRDLTLREIHLQTGSWSSIFVFLGEEMPTLTSLHLSNLWDTCEVSGKRLINLHPTWAECSRPKDEWTQSRGLGAHTRTFGPDDLQKGLTFRPPSRGFVSSPWYHAWKQRREKEFGCVWSMTLWDGR